MKTKLSEQLSLDSNGNTRPRAHSAPTVSLYSTRPSPQAFAQIAGLEGYIPGANSPHPALRKISHNGLNSSIFQAASSAYLQRGSRASIHGTRLQTLSICSRHESLEMRCCRINVLLVTMQLCLGTTVTGLGFYMETLSPTLHIRECPYWAGIPTLLAGVLGIYFCATDFAAYQGSKKAFVIKCICFLLSTACVFLCMIASVFPGIHGNRISGFLECNMVEMGCECVKTANPHAKVYTYRAVESCDVVVTSIKDYFILQCALNAIASGVCLWFVTLLWKSRYQSFHAGVRFYPYSPDMQPQQWQGPAPSQPYIPNGHPPSPICIKKASAPPRRVQQYGSAELLRPEDGHEPLRAQDV